MANNRLWAVCKDDNKAVSLSKYYFGCSYGGDWHDRDKFFEEHDNCPSNKGCGENILFVTEIDDRVENYDFRDTSDIRIYLKD